MASSAGAASPNGSKEVRRVTVLAMRFTVFLNPEGTSRLPKDVSQLTKVQLEANPDDSIWDLAKQGEADSGIEVRQGRLLFPTPPDDKWCQGPGRCPTCDREGGRRAHVA